MRGYQKLKKENQELWDYLKIWINNAYRCKMKEQEADKQTEKELAWIKAMIQNETK